MAGQQQIQILNQENYLADYSKKMLEQADLYYVEKRFLLSTKYDEKKFLHSYLYQDALCTDNCDLITWVDKKIAGLLEHKKQKPINLDTLKVESDNPIVVNIFEDPHKWNSTTVNGEPAW